MITPTTPATKRRLWTPLRRLDFSLRRGEGPSPAGGHPPGRHESGLSDEVTSLIGGIRDVDEYLRRQEAKIWAALHRVDGARSDAAKTAAQAAFLTVLHGVQSDERLRRCLDL